LEFNVPFQHGYIRDEKNKSSQGLHRVKWHHRSQ